jgi:hypothetical protein
MNQYNIHINNDDDDEDDNNDDDHDDDNDNNNNNMTWICVNKIHEDDPKEDRGSHKIQTARPGEDDRI